VLAVQLEAAVSGPAGGVVNRIRSNLLVQIEMPIRREERLPVTLANKTRHAAVGNMQCAMAFYPQEEESPWIV
jgi:hypothetical protein